MNSFEEALVFHLAPLHKALIQVAAVMTVGRLKHPDDDGFRQPAAFHAERANKHLESLERGDRSEDHLSHAACRLLMALEAALR